MTTASVLPVPSQSAPKVGPEAMRARVKVPVRTCQRVANAEAMVLATLAEHSLPFTFAPVMVKLAQTLAADKVALSGLKLSRTAAAYKVVHGLRFTFSERIFSNTRKYPFSINLDESATNGDKKVLSIQVSYFNPDRKMVDVEHLGSLEIFKVSALKLEKLLVKFFEDNNIPWCNLVIMLMDSCGVMRGSKMGLETRVRQNHCPSLLDVDGDSCHHIHNASKVFAAPFSNHLEQLFGDLYADHQWATDQGSQTLVHKLHDKQIQVFTNFLACFVKSEPDAQISGYHGIGQQTAASIPGESLPGIHLVCQILAKKVATAEQDPPVFVGHGPNTERALLNWV
ncbi:uncharacterized protein [Misgurnus anguillicaudatus]|uniref:uncharacterized protein n=1 Tax=Misgurnus anguillicaudatus TaxID=75329 RepID=UPI003CCF4877